MKDWSKTRIRLGQVRARQLKISYKRLNQQEKKLIKVFEVLDQNEKDMNDFWRYNTKRDANNHIILNDRESDYFKYLDDQRESYWKRRDRIQLKNNWSDEKVEQIRYLHMRDNLHNTSY